MDNAAKIKSWLRTRPKKYFCVNCVMAGTGVEPFQQVNQIVRPLEGTRDFRYMKTTCSECSSDQKCVGYFGDF